jgi:hypothetical protein
VPSTEKWSSDKSGATSRWARIAAITFRDMSVGRVANAVEIPGRRTPSI